MTGVCSPATRNYRLAAIHSFVSYLQYEVIDNAEEWQKVLSIKAMRSESKALTYLSTEGIRLLLRQPDTMTSQGRRRSNIISCMTQEYKRLPDLTVESVRIDYEPYSMSSLVRVENPVLFQWSRNKLKYRGSIWLRTILNDSNVCISLCSSTIDTRSSRVKESRPFLKRMQALARKE